MWKKFWSFPWQPCAQVNDSTTWVCFLGESVPLEQGEGGIFSVFIAKYFAVGFFFFLSANSWPEQTSSNESQVRQKQF